MCDLSVIEKRIKSLSSDKQALFGAVCCERLLHNYLYFHKVTGWGNYDYLRKTLDLIWSILVREKKKNSEYINLLSERCEEYAPDLDVFEDDLAPAAQDACLSICCLLDFLNKKKPNDIIQIATYSTDTVDLFIQTSENINPNDSQLEEKILNHPLMQNELNTQAQILDALEKTKTINNQLIQNLKITFTYKSNLNLSL